jgi:hypothetical protein
LVQEVLSEEGFPNVYIPRKDIPPFLQMNPEICATIKHYAREHLSELYIEFLYEYHLTTTSGRKSGTEQGRVG